MQTKSQAIADGMVVSMAYTLTVDGVEIASAAPDEPMEYLHGYQEILPGLENALTGKRVNDSFSITLAPDQAYGDYDAENFEEIDRADIPDSESLEVGMVLEVEDEEGEVWMAHVAEIKGNTVVLDFNPPLAGKTLTYSVTVTDVRMATDEELDHGHAHGSIYDWDDEDDDWDDDDEDEDESDDEDKR
jgi:FKBP-type peptidyl-prolyl cis-trans isomerase SlyD